jgi:putative transcriptional regulator
MDEDDFNGIIQGLSEAAALMRGEDVPGIRVHVPTDSDVRAIRGRLGLSRTDFAKRFSLPLGTVRDWEQGRRAPDTASRNLLKIIDREPEAAARALEAGLHRPGA